MKKDEVVSATSSPPLAFCLLSSFRCCGLCLCRAEGDRSGALVRAVEIDVPVARRALLGPTRVAAFAEVAAQEDGVARVAHEQNLVAVVQPVQLAEDCGPRVL